MGQRRAHSRMCGRIWDMMSDEEVGDLATYDIYKWYGSQWDVPCDQRTLGQVLLRSSMFRRVAWEYKGRWHYELADCTSHDVYQYYGWSKSTMVAVWRPRTLDDIIEPYVEAKHTLRPLKNMPKFIRDAVKEASQ